MKTAALCLFALFVTVMVIVTDLLTEADRRRIRNTRHIIEELNNKDTSEHHSHTHHRD